MRKLIWFLGAMLALGTVFVGAPAYAKTVDCAAYVGLCDQFPSANSVNCSDIGHQVQVVVPGVDPWNLDADDDGTGCESSAPAPTSAPPTSAKPTSSKTAQTSQSTSRPETTEEGVAGPTLPKTGPGAPLAALVGGSIALGGAVLLWLVRRRRERFEA